MVNYEPERVEVFSYFNPELEITDRGCMWSLITQMFLHILTLSQREVVLGHRLHTFSSFLTLSQDNR